MKALKKYQSVMPENVHCAKTYDNLGRVFQALEKPDVSIWNGSSRENWISNGIHWIEFKGKEGEE